MNRVNAYMGDHTILTTLAYGPKIYLDTRDLSMTGHLVLDGYWENWITKLFISMVKPGMTVLDIGANCGYYSLLAAHLVGTQGTVHAFEPNPFHHENFIRNQSINGFRQMHLHKVALTDKEGEITLYSPVKLTASASIHKNHNAGLEDVDQVVSVKVPTVRLSEYLPGLKANIIKIDIEGAEPLIKDSLFEVIDNSGDVEIIMEYNPVSWMNQGYDCKPILEEFVQHGFQIYIIRHDSTLLPVTTTELVEMTKEHTYFDLYMNNKKLHREM